MVVESSLEDFNIGLDLCSALARKFDLLGAFNLPTPLGQSTYYYLARLLGGSLALLVVDLSEFSLLLIWMLPATSWFSVLVWFRCGWFSLGSLVGAPWLIPFPGCFSQLLLGSLVDGGLLLVMPWPLLQCGCTGVFGLAGNDNSCDTIFGLFSVLWMPT